MAVTKRPAPGRRRAVLQGGAAIVGVGALAALMAGCHDDSSTSLRVVVTWGALTVDQLEFTVWAADLDVREAVVPAAIRPPRAGAPLSSGEDVIILLADKLDGAGVRCRVSALRNGQLQQVAESPAVIVRRRQAVTCPVMLGSIAPLVNQANGAACLDGRQCATGFCVDGVCCDRACGDTCMACDIPSSPGVCSFVPAGISARSPTRCPDRGPAACGTDGRCDGRGACQRYPRGTPCAGGACNGSAIQGGKVCDGSGVCTPGPIVNCAPFLCDDTATPAACRLTCTSSDQCVGGKSCDAGSCGKKADGGACGAGDQCVSGHCADGVCCDSACDGACVACDQIGFVGTCRPVPAGVTDPNGVCKNSRGGDPTSCRDSGACDGNGACAKYAADTVCRPASCSGTTLIGAGTCDGAGACRDGAGVRCTPFGCRDGKCNATCAGDGDCAPGRACDTATMSCGLKGIGQVCAAGADCASGFCVDGLCCNEACDGACRSCALSSSPGVCKNVAPGLADPRRQCAAADVSTCGTDGLCDGNGGCRRYPAATVCSPAGCAGSTRTLASTCDDQGQCVVGQSRSCAPYRCNGAGCFVSCGSDAECLYPFVCLGGACALKPNGAACQLSEECQSGGCIDGVCCVSALCPSCQQCNVAGSLGRCAPVAALAADPRGACADRGPNACDTDGKCDGAGACHRYAAGTACSTPTCSGSTLSQPAACNGSGACVAGAMQSCAPYVCDGTVACKKTCSMPTDCVGANVCAGGSCGLKPQGATCGTSGECATGFCTDGVCCGEAACPSCKACNVTGKAGTCQSVAPGAADPRGACVVEAPATCGRNGRCDGNGQCQRYAPGTVCGTGSCAGTLLTPAATCDSAGRCVPASTSSDCSPYACAPGGCAGTCATDGDCAPRFSCLGTACKKKVTGAVCATGDQCETGNCVDGVCCGSPTCALCQACNRAESLGTCTNVGAGLTDPRGGCRVDAATSCGQDGTCNGAGACRRYPAGTVCAPATCDKKKSQNPKTCDGAGVCTARGTVNCAPDDCDAATGVCP
jgi:hypothetical protein